MRRYASEVLEELEIRLARLERQADNNDRYADDMFADDMFADDMFADEMFAGRRWDGKGNQRDYNKPPAPKNQPDCYSEDNWEGLGKPGEGETCYRLHNEYGSANAGKPGSPERKEYNRKYREQWMDSKTIKRKGPLPGSKRRR